MERLKVANAIVAFTKAMKLNHQLPSKVGSVLANLLHTRLDSDELFEYCKDLQGEKKDLAGKMKGIVMEKDEFAKVVVDLKA